MKNNYISLCKCEKNLFTWQVGYCIYSHNMGSNPKKSMNGVFFLSMNFLNCVKRLSCLCIERTFKTNLYVQSYVRIIFLSFGNKLSND
jgi:hypothetical protein